MIVQDQKTNGKIRIETGTKTGLTDRNMRSIMAIGVMKMTREDELLEKFKQLTDTDKIKALLYLDRLIAHQDTHPASQGSPASGEQPAT